LRLRWAGERAKTLLPDRKKAAYESGPKSREETPKEGEHGRDAIAAVLEVCIPPFSASHHTTYVPGTMRTMHGWASHFCTYRLYITWHR
jgi:hypothetical protein